MSDDWYRFQWGLLCGGARSLCVLKTWRPISPVEIEEMATLSSGSNMSSDYCLSGGVEIYIQ
jgi:hypothetical protein